MILNLKKNEHGNFAVHFATNDVYLGDIAKGDDGYFYFWYNGRGGSWDAYVLSALAEQLDTLNYEWDQEVQAALSGEPAYSYGDGK